MARATQAAVEQPVVRVASGLLHQAHPHPARAWAAVLVRAVLLARARVARFAQVRVPVRVALLAPVLAQARVAMLALVRAPARAVTMSSLLAPELALLAEEQLAALPVAQALLR